jgi:hypothetical protein
VAVRIEAWIEVDDEEFHRKGDDALPQEHDLEHDPTVHAAGNGQPDARSRPGHAGLLHELASLSETGLLGVPEFSPLGHGGLLMNVIRGVNFLSGFDRSTMRIMSL